MTKRQFDASERLLGTNERLKNTCQQNGFTYIVWRREET
jgi:hypothetical protein